MVISPPIVSKGIPGLTLTLNDTQLKNIFKQHDTNKDGQLDKKELKEAFRHLGALIPAYRAGRALCHADYNGDGYISEQELGDLVNYALKLEQPASPKSLHLHNMFFMDFKSVELRLDEDQLRKIFKKHDKDRDDRLSREELKEAFKELGACIPEYRARQAHKLADTNGDGFVSNEEMSKLVEYAFKLGYTIS
ncbi:hypothetical protein F0562_027270 [Nyssa sinensis]|uniref:EF-hand domain-containing protein n=1 Tax=Nyssa sinensis TaxID=561372 RepID=A0A5J5B553_9ASTE|nr:hypothetical protein F0562_027270 [Nyssa sinensis]